MLGTNTNNKRIINLKDNEIITPISSWKTHYISWRQVKKNFLLIKYENLINNPKKEFIKITNYLSKILNLTFSDKKIDNCISSNSFEKLKQQEKMFGFSESISDKITGARKNFFNLGPNNNWQKLLDKKIVNEIEKKFENEMRELGYI